MGWQVLQHPPYSLTYVSSYEPCTVMEHMKKLIMVKQRPMALEFLLDIDGL
jgi:hypothetical protein